MSLMLPPARNTGIDDNHFRWMEPRDERELFEKQVRAMMRMSTGDFLQKLDQGAFDEALDEDNDHNLTYLVMLSDLGR